MDGFSRLRSFLDHFEAKALIAGLLLVVSSWVFIWIADDVVPEVGEESIDASIMRWMRIGDSPGELHGPTWIGYAAGELTALGSVPVLILAAVVTVGFLLISGRWREAIFMSVAAGGGGFFNDVLKSFFSRPRPEIVPHLVEVSSFSFPSGHAMASATTYLVIGAIGASLAPRNSQKFYIVAVAVFVTLLVGATRIVLGVHYPSDVLAGWTAGLTWALACWVVHERLQGRLLRSKKSTEAETA